MAGSVEQLEQIGEETLLARVAAGDEVGAIASEAGVHRDTFYKWLKRGGQARQDAFREARRQSADYWVELSREELQKAARPGATTAEVQSARNLADFYKWRAERYNRSDYGAAETTVNVNLTTAELHLDALRKHGSVSHVLAAAPPLVLEGRTEPCADD